MAQASLPSMDEDRYRAEVLLLGDNETETEAEQKLVTEARELGLKVPEIEIAASFAASGVLDIPPSPLSANLTRLSLEHNSLSDRITSGATSVERRADSLSETILSDHIHSGSLPSIASLSTRPTSFSSSDGRPAYINDRISPQRHGSASSAVGSGHRRRTSFINAIGKLPFRKRRSTSSVTLPPNAHITIQRKEGNMKTVLIETKTDAHGFTEALDAEGEGVAGADDVLKLEIPVFDEAVLQRNLDDPELKDMHESHQSEKLRFVTLQNGILDSLKAKHLIFIADKKLDNERVETERHAQNAAQVARMEMRQLIAEMTQLEEFEKEKRNSRTRIKYMEGYFSTFTPPQSPYLGSDSSLDVTQPARTVTRRQKEQLEQEYFDRDAMSQLHEARIKVLRERQERQLQDTISRLEKELEDLIDKNAEAVAELERDHQREEEEILQAFDLKKIKLKRRWILEEAILRKKLEIRDEVPYGPLPPLFFSNVESEKPTLKDPFADSGSAETAQ